MSTSKRTVSREEWTAAREALLVKEKAFTHERDALSAARRELPMVKVTAAYVFEGPDGKRTLAELFEGKRQLIVYHFMFGPKATEGCKGCSFVSDHVEGGLPHLGARDTSFVAVSRGPLANFEPFKKRMGWTFRWVSSAGSDFNFDYGASKRSVDAGGNSVESESPGLSVFLREGGDVFHTYSTYGRGLDLLIGAYNYLDLTPLGRHEDELEFPMAWVRHHDKYESTAR